MRLRALIFALTGVTDPKVRDAITGAWRERGRLDGNARRAYLLPEAARTSGRATLAWVLLTMAQDEPRFFAVGLLALVTLPVLALLALVSAFLERG